MSAKPPPFAGREVSEVGARGQEPPISTVRGWKTAQANQKVSTCGSVSNATWVPPGAVEPSGISGRIGARFLIHKGSGADLPRSVSFHRSIYSPPALTGKCILEEGES